MPHLRLMEGFREDPGLHQLQHHRAAVGLQRDQVQVVLVVGLQAVEHDVGPEALHRHRCGAARGQALVQVGQRRGAGHQDGKAVGKRVLGVDVARPALGRQALLFRIEAHQARLAAEEVAEPLRGQRAHVVGGHLVVPDTGAAGLFHRVQRHVQRQHARRTQHHVVAAQRDAHQRQARRVALGDHGAGVVHHHPGAVQLQPGLDQQRLVDGDAGAGLHGCRYSDAIEQARVSDTVVQGAAARVCIVGHRPRGRRYDGRMTLQEPDDEAAIHQEPRLWRDNGWTARVIKNNDDDGWAVEMIKPGRSRARAGRPLDHGPRQEEPQAAGHQRPSTRW
jgi:hypothetical protein